jgi:hypothetical protein
MAPPPKVLFLVGHVEGAGNHEERYTLAYKLNADLRSEPMA